jgi:hypothetical protein
MNIREFSSSRVSTLVLLALIAALAAYAFSLRSKLTALERASAAPRAPETPRLALEHAPASDRPEPATPGLETTPPSTPEDAQSAGGIAAALGTPEMRQLVRLEALGEAKKGYADLLKRWNLSQTEADQFLQFVADRDSADAADALSMLATGKLDESAIAEQEERQVKAKAESAAQLKVLLGEQRYAEFEQARARREQLQAVSSYRDHLEAAGAPLTHEQRDALAKIVMAEKPDQNDWLPEDVEFFTQGMADESLAKIRQRLEAAQARITQHAAGFLSPDQVSALQAAFRAELDEQDVALKLARNLFRSGTGTPPAE